MYLKDKTIKVSIRISPEQMDFLSQLSVLYGLSVSEVIRALLDSYKVVFSHENK